VRDTVPETSPSGASVDPPDQATPASARSAETDTGQLLMIGRVGGRLFALPAASVERVVRMAALTPLPAAPPGIVGVLNFRGKALPAVDPRPRLGCPSPAFHPSQRLIVVTAGTRYLLWVDEIERIVAVESDALDPVGPADDGALTPFMARLEGLVIPVLSPDALDPGFAVRGSGRGVR
jgi:purine-binding chemotaxis protein CheW